MEMDAHCETVGGGMLSIQLKINMLPQSEAL